MKIAVNDFVAPEGKDVELMKRPTWVDPVYDSKQTYKDMLQDHVERLDRLQQLLYASNAHAILLLFQGMDAAGKDGAIRHVMSGINPQGCDTHSFKQPSTTELAHDFLWRSARVAPERGRIGIFNRSYYEDTLIVRVHPELLEPQGFGRKKAADSNFWNRRYQSIVDFERHLHRNSTRVVKFFLHLSKEEQRKRFLSRIDEPQKSWKLSQSDISERQYWTAYMMAYEESLTRTTTTFAPWHVVPADDKENARLIVSQIILDVLEGFDMSYPTPTEDRRHALESYRKQLLSE